MKQWGNSAGWQNANYSIDGLYFGFPTSATALEPWGWRTASQTSDLSGMEIEKISSSYTTTQSLNTIESFPETKYLIHFLRAS